MRAQARVEQVCGPRRERRQAEAGGEELALPQPAQGVERLDVHDVGDYMIDNEWRSLENGMVLTIEPGIYIDDSEDIPKEYRKIGVRIEDMVLVNNSSPEVMTCGLAKEINEIEEIISNELN